MSPDVRPESRGSDRPRDDNADSAQTFGTRRDMVWRGAKVVFVAPVISTFFASQAYAANYSCYPEGHTCDAVSETKRQQCCGDLTCSGDPGVCE